jgi:flagellar hook assembly protein FlgD
VTAVEITDVAGRRVRTLEARGASESFDWDGRDQSGAQVPAGIYFARVTTTEGVAGARIVRLR